MRFVLMCQVLEGETPMQIKWLKDGAELSALSVNEQPGAASTLDQQQESSDEQAQQPQLMANGGDQLSASVLFKRVQQQHAGNYTCLATNHFGSSAFSSIMSVKGE